MRYIHCFLFILIALCLFSSAFADEIKCYSSGKLIYSGMGDDFLYSEGVFSFAETKTNKVVFVAADCIVKITD